MADAGVGIETLAGGAGSWGMAGTAGAGMALRQPGNGSQLGLGLGWNILQLGLVLRQDADTSGTYLDVLTNLVCTGIETTGAGVAVSQLA